MTSRRWAGPEDARAFLAGDEVALGTFAWVQAQVAGLGGAELRVAKTQLTWARRRGFAFMWSASRWLGTRGSPCVLSIALPALDQDQRWKQAVQVRSGLWMHHLEVPTAAVLDSGIAARLAEAYLAAG